MSTMTYKMKVICAFWVICFPSLILAETLVRSETYTRTKENDIDCSVNLRSVQNVFVTAILTTTVVETKGLNCFMMNESTGHVANQSLAGVRCKK